MSQIIDLDRYPFHQPESQRLKSLMARGKSALEREALFSLEGFLRPEVIGSMAKELAQLVPRATRYEARRVAYLEREPAFGENHPHNQEHACSYHQILNYQIANDSRLRQIYYWQPLTDFLGKLCGYDSFFRSDCPHLALTAKVAGHGDTDGWHYDTNDVVFSLLLQAPEAGGEFEYAPHVRSETDERYDAVEAVLADPDRLAARPPMAVGNLTVFKGDLSLHRVTPVEGARRRIVALFSYDRQPGMTFAQGYIEELQSRLPDQAAKAG
ncbi:MAG: 2OG-Fe(II) oxygenase [Alphaproteobacteria bacterium]|nr:2OG-Fe(II) oxygenase [Alphaproteobacteria bacterium]